MIFKLFSSESYSISSTPETEEQEWTVLWRSMLHHLLVHDMNGFCGTLIVKTVFQSVNDENMLERSDKQV